MKNFLTLLALSTLVATGAWAQTSLAPASARVSDATISDDQRGYEALQARIKALNDGGRPLHDHHLAKAQCWLDTSFHEYTRNDRGPWPQVALTEAEALVAAMERRLQALPMDTPLVAGAPRIRPDLWQRAAALRGHAGWPCAQARAACAEVELVHAGHEQAQLGWRHARPYVQIAEDLLGDADVLANRCVAPPAPSTVVAAPAAAVAPAAVQAESAPVVAPVRVVVREPNEVLLFAQVVFQFDRFLRDDIAAGGLVALQALLQKVKTEGLVLQAVQLSGHADRLNATRQPDYNQALSERRVLTIRELLVAEGIAPALIRVEAQGDRQPRTRCEPLAGAALQDCLLPDRRVEVLAVTRRP